MRMHRKLALGATTLAGSQRLLARERVRARRARPSQQAGPARGLHGARPDSPGGGALVAGSTPQALRARGFTVERRLELEGNRGASGASTPWRHQP